MNYKEIPITDEQLKYAREISKEIHERRKKDYNNKGSNAKQNPRKEDFKGFLAETVFADVWGLDRPEPEDDIDKGYDFKMDGTKYQIKGTTYIDGDLILFKDDIEKDWDILIHIELDLSKPRTARIYNSISKDDFKEKMKTKDYGYGERYSVGSDDL